MRYKISTGVVLRAAKARGLTVSTMAIFEGASGAEIRIEPQPEGSRPDKPPMPFYALTGILVALMSDSERVETMVSREEIMAEGWAGKVCEKWPFHVAQARAVRIGIARLLGLPEGWETEAEFKLVVGEVQ
jgi:hypothetical protein